MIMARHLFRRVMRRGRVIGLLALSSAPALTLWLVGLDGDNDPATLYSDVLATVGYSFAIAVLILTVAVLREERDAGTLPYLYMRPISRFGMSLAATGAGVAAALTLALGAWIASAVALLAIGGDIAMAVPGLAHFGAAAVGYGAVFVPLGYLVPRSILVGLGYVVVVESILAAVVTGLANLSIFRIALSIFADIAAAWDPRNAGDVLGPIAPGAGGGIAKLVVVLIVGLSVLTWALRRRDAL